MLRSFRFWASGLLLGSSLTFASPAEAQRVEQGLGFGAHLAYGLGGALASDELGSGLRHNLDASFLMGEFLTHPAAMWRWRNGWAAGPLVASGFGAYPTYLGAEGGYAHDVGMAAGAALLGLVARVDPESGAGASVRVTGDIALVELGVRGIVIFLGEPELQITGLIGIGRF